MCVRVLPHSSLSRLVQSVCDCAWVSVWASVCARAADPRALTGIRAAFKRKRERRFSFNVCVVVLPSLCCLLSYTCMNTNGPLSVLLVMINELIIIQGQWPRDTIPVSFVVVMHHTLDILFILYATTTAVHYTIIRLTFFFFCLSKGGNPIHFANRFFSSSFNL